MTIVEKLLNDFDEMDKLFPEDYVTSIINDAFDNNANCRCTYEGSSHYFSMSQMQWYPGDEPEYEVDGYDDYVDEILDVVISDICMEYNIERTDDVVTLIKDNLNILTNDKILDESDFEEKAIEKYLNNPYEVL